MGSADDDAATCGASTRSQATQMLQPSAASAVQ
jgi:hypothetical protein